MSAHRPRVRNDQDGREGRITQLDANYRALVRWDEHSEPDQPEWSWVTRRHLIILDERHPGGSHE